jgi:DcuC family C4-dicarboxylate transporter
MPDQVILPLAVAIIGVAIVSVARGVDVRLALLTAALALGLLRGDPAPIVREFLITFSNEKFVVPICTAMGFAYVLRHTGCDRALVLLLTRPLKYARPILIPGVVLVGFLVNIPVISQTSTAVCIGAVVVPLMRAAGMSNLTIGSTLLFGASIGGELLNPGAPELNTVAQRLAISPKEVIPSVVPLLFTHLIIATLIFWFLSARHERKQPTPAEVPISLERITFLSTLRAGVPLLPLVLLFLSGPPLNLISIPERWMVAPPKQPTVEAVAPVAEAPPVVKKKDSSYETRLIGLAMLIGVLAAAVACPQTVRGIPKAFFEGAGYAFTEVVSLIVIASCFGKGVEIVGLADLIGHSIREMPGLLIPVASAIPCAFAALSGSGMASTQSLYGFFVEPAQALGVDPKDIGGLVSLSAAAGRTMSPVAAVALMAGKLSGTSSFELAKRVSLPLLISLAILVVLRVGKIL